MTKRTGITPTMKSFAVRRPPAKEPEKKTVFWKKVSKPQIISVSRRTDIPALYGNWFMNALDRGFAGYVNPFGGTKHLVSLRREHVACFVFWSKNFAPFMDHLNQIQERGYNCIFHFTITGLSNPFESNVIHTAKAVEALREISRRFSPDPIHWRYDPIVISDRTGEGFHLKTFESLASKLEGFVKRCIISYPTLYGKVTRSIARLKMEKGLTLMDTEKGFKIELANKLATIAGRHGITMHTCCGDYLIGEKIFKAHCVDGDLIADLFFKDNCIFKSKPTRKECGCAESTDIGAYDTCTNGCFYCYANSNKEKARRALSRHDPRSAFLGYSYQQSEAWIRMGNALFL